MIWGRGKAEGWPNLRVGEEAKDDKRLGERGEGRGGWEGDWKHMRRSSDMNSTVVEFGENR